MKSWRPLVGLARFWKPRLAAPCIHQHAPDMGVPGLTGSPLLSALAARRDVDLVSTPVDDAAGLRLRRHVSRRDDRRDQTSLGLGAGGIHRSRGRRAANYLAFALSSAVRSLTLPRPDVILASSPPVSVATVGALAAARFRRPWCSRFATFGPSPQRRSVVDQASPLYRLVDRVARRHTSHAGAVLVPNAGLVEGVRKHGARDVRVVTGAVLDERPTDEERRRARGARSRRRYVCSRVSRRTRRRERSRPRA